MKTYHIVVKSLKNLTFEVEADDPVGAIKSLYGPDSHFLEWEGPNEYMVEWRGLVGLVDVKEMVTRAF